jgi:hypothetical protein
MDSEIVQDRDDYPAKGPIYLDIILGEKSGRAYHEYLIELAVLQGTITDLLGMLSLHRQVCWLAGNPP